MEIEVGDYILCSDKFCMWIDEKRISEKTGKVRRERVGGYAPDFDSLLQDFKRRKIRGSDAKSLEELLWHLAKLSIDMGVITATALKEDFRRIEKWEQPKKHGTENQTDS